MIKEDPVVHKDPVINKGEKKIAATFPYKIIVTMVILTIILCGGIAWYVWGSYREVRDNQPRYLRIQELNGTITHLDEVLTMSVRLWAVTGEERWEQRYLKHEPQLTTAVQEVQRLAPSSYATASNTIETATTELIQMNRRAFNLAHQGKSSEAVELLLGEEYEREKRQYSEGLQQMARDLQQEVAAFHTQQRNQVLQMSWIIIGILVLLLIVWGATLNMVRRYIDERKKSEAAFAKTNRELIAKEEESKTFLHGVSHDLRSPVTGILGFLSELDYTREEIRIVLLEPPSADTHARCLTLVDEQLGEMIRFIRSSAERLNHLLEALLRLSRTGKIESHPEAVEINPLIERILNTLQGTIAKSGATINAAELPPALGDPTMIEQIFANLIGNALKYLDPKRPGVITIGHGSVESGSVRQKDMALTPGMQLYFVKDNGLGIPAHAMPKLFQVFQRFHPGVAAGEGVGLTIVRRAVERHGGRVWCESVEGAGSVFFVELPVVN